SPVPDHGSMHRSPGPEASRSRRWLARLSLVLVGLAVVIVVAFARLASFAMVAVGVAGAVVTLAAAYLFLSRRGAPRLGGLARGGSPYPDRRDRRPRPRRPAVGGDPGGRPMAARGRDGAAGAGRGPGDGLAHAGISGQAAGRPSVLHHEPQVRRGKGWQV